MVRYFYKMMLILLIPLCSYSQKSNPTKKETFDFIVYECKYFDHPGYYPKQKLVEANYENMTLQVMDEVSNSYYTSIKSTLNLNDISDVKFHQDTRDSMNIIYEVTVYFKIPYPTIRYKNNGEKFEITDTDEIFYFSSRSEAKKIYKALLHMQSIVGVKKQLFSGD